MPTRSRSLRAVVCALGLAGLLLATSWSALPAGGSAAEEPTPDLAVDAGDDGAVAEAVGDLDCTSGFGEIHDKPEMSLHGVALMNDGAIAVGFTHRRGDNIEVKRRPAAIYHVADTWTRVLPGSPGNEDGLVAVAAGRRDEAWAVGFMTIGGRVMPLAMRWNGERWITDRPKPRGQGQMPAMFTDVVTLGDGEPFAVGYRMTGDGKRLPIVARRDGRRWIHLDPKVGRFESVSLTGVSPDRRGGLWVVGHGGPGAEIDPVIYRRADSRWTRSRVPDLAGEAVLADVVATAPDDAWAVGYQRETSGSRPLVLRWDGERWRRIPAPEFGSEDVVLTAASVATTGGVWVVGAAWNAEIRSHQAVAAWWDGQAWEEIAGPRGGTELHDVVGALDADGWAVGRAGRQARTTRVCTPPQTGIFGGSEPAEPGPVIRPADDLAKSTIASVERSTADGTADDGVDGVDGAVAGTATAPDPVARAGLAETTAAETDAGRDAESAERATGRQILTRRNRNVRGRAGQSRRARRPSIPMLPRARVHQHLVARDVTQQAGLTEATATYGAVVADFDADGRDDLYIGRHGRAGRLVLNQGGSFVDAEHLDFPAIDRHGCAAADIDGSGLPDLYCTVGGKRGSGLKSNELWIDPAGSAPADVAVPGGVADPLGRGRHAVFLETDGGEDAHLVVTNSPTRVDGLPSVGRLFRVDGERRFLSRARTGFASRLGSLTLVDADYDGDGREDLLLVTGGPQSPRDEGSHVYRNARRGLIDVTRELEIRPMGEVDADLLDLNGDRQLDLVQLSPTRLRISLFIKGRYVKVYERRLSHGRAIAGGDVNGDGRDDLYIVRSNGVRNSTDVLLLNAGGGRSWSSMVIPQVYSGDGEDAVAIDHDGNGREDFLVLNGRTQRGPTQLIAFYRR